MLARLWKRWSLRRRQYDGGAAVLDALYDRADPWNLTSDAERQRFEATDAWIRQHCPAASSLLEIGCGEGLQTRRFLRLADHVTGVDLSAQALDRARIAAPEAVFLEGELTQLGAALPRARYDVATLCEVLYYMADPAETLACARQCAQMVIVTIYAPQAQRLAPLMQGDGWREETPIEAGRKRWRVWIWIAT